MGKPRSGVRIWTAVLLMLAAALPGAQARPVHVWTIDEIASKADAIAVGEVISVTPGRFVPAEQTAWRIPLRLMTARIRVLRVSPSASPSGLTVGDVIALGYQAIDWSRIKGGVGNGPDFPHLSVRDCFAFPLMTVRPEGKEHLSWRLMGEEAFGLLVPCIKQAPTGEAATGKQFLLRELANTISAGSYDDVARAGRYLNHYYVNDELSQPIYDLIAPRVRDENRWLLIAVGVYNSMGTPRPKILELARGEEAKGAPAALVAKALAHVNKDHLDDRIIELTIERAGERSWGELTALLENYGDDPTTLRLLKDRLAARKPEAVFVAQRTIENTKKPDPSLVKAAVAAADARLRQRGGKPDGDLSGAVRLIRDYGSDKQFAAVLDELRSTRKTDRQRYRVLLQSMLYVKSDRLIPVIRIIIQDSSPLPSSGDTRPCDIAAAELQRLTGDDFGVDLMKPAAERDKAVEKARTWLAEHPGGAAK